MTLILDIFNQFYLAAAGGFAIKVVHMKSLLILILLTLGGPSLSWGALAPTKSELDFPYASTFYPACGQQIHVNMHIDARSIGTPYHLEVLPGIQGSTQRRLIVFPDKSWLITFDFLDDAFVEVGVVCIVAAGSHRSLDTAPGIGLSMRVRSLPTELIGLPYDRAALEKRFALGSARDNPSRRRYNTSQNSDDIPFELIN